MTENALVDSVFASLGEEFCWHARQHAFLLGDEYVDTKHLLLAAAEVSPVELHGVAGLTAKRLVGLLDRLASCKSGTSLSDRRPQRLSPAAQHVVLQVTDIAAKAGRPPSLCDVWTALLADGKGYVWFLLRQLGIEPGQLRQRLLG